MSEQQIPAMTEQEVARRLGLSVATLRAWRLKRKGPRFVRFGRAVRYLPADIDQYVQASGVSGDPDASDIANPIATGAPR